MRLTRTYRFAASHRLHSDQLSADKNRELYGKCNNPYGHGHDYVLRVTVRGEPDSTTGRVVELGRLDRYISRLILDVFDHKDLNIDVPGFRSVPTTENLVLDIERRLRSEWSAHFGDRVGLDRVWVQETPRNMIELRNS
jgi:6-pyruvoyltetrahydropterin/6-carboxytetrahydropterin synthase